MPKLSNKKSYLKKEKKIIEHPSDYSDEEDEEYEEAFEEDEILEESDEEYVQKKTKKTIKKRVISKSKQKKSKDENETKQDEKEAPSGEKLEKMIDEKLTDKEKKTVEDRIQSFKKLYEEGDAIDWFNELCFCLLTANSKASTAIKIQEFLGRRGFLDKTETELVKIISDHGHRFKNKKAQFICAARQQFMKKFLKNQGKTEENEEKKQKKKDSDGIEETEDFKTFLSSKSAYQAREYLVDHVKGLGFKESSHFLRNIGFSDKVAIIDRHVLRFLHSQGLIEEIPKTITKAKYIEIEKKMLDIFNLPMDELDLKIFCFQQGNVLK